MSNVVELFFRAADQNTARAAFVAEGDVAVTYGELRSRVAAVAAGLTAAGMKAGDRALFMLPMSVELYVAVLGALAAGGVAVFVDPWVSIGAIARLAAAAEARVFVGTPKAHLLRMTSAKLRDVPISVTTGGPFASLLARYTLDGFRGDVSVPGRGDDEPALITFTTGSSGVPKGVNRTHGILAAQHHVIREEFPADAGDVDLTTFPVFALSNLAAGITTVIPPINLRRVASADPGRVLRMMQRHGVTTAAASPPVFDLLASHSAATGARHRMRRIVTGGAPVRDEQLATWRAIWPGAEISVAYGSSEAEPVASISADERLEYRNTATGVCVGRSVAAVRTRVVKITRGPMTEPRDMERGTMGELLVAGPHVCREYVGDAAAFAANKVRDADGTIWHRMGDTGRFDDDGRFWLVGRVHSTIERGGEQYHATVVESVARGTDARIRRVAAVGLPDPGLGERLSVVIEADDRGVEAGVFKRLEDARVPVDKLYVTPRPLPVDPRHNSKIDYERLRELLERGAVR